MISWMATKIATKRLDAFQRAFSYDVTYMRDILRMSPRGFRAFRGFLRWGRFREGAPAEAIYAASVAATLAEDCGPCTQLVVTMAERAGVSANALRAFISVDVERMPSDGALAFHFARAVLRRAPELDDLRAKIAARWGEGALVTLIFAVASSRVYPTVKYALGHGHACGRIRVAGRDVLANGAAAA
jgi:hypothetical protein